MTFGLAPIYEILNMNKEKEVSLYDLLIIPMNTNIETLSLAEKLRSNNIKVLIEMKKKLNKSLDWANRNNIPYVIVLGENEIKENKINIKNMKTGENILVNLDNIDEIIRVIK